jgi:hypothetical protein
MSLDRALSLLGLSWVHTFSFYCVYQVVSSCYQVVFHGIRSPIVYILYFSQEDTIFDGCYVVEMNL